jgi:hypothetical protein
LLPVILFLRPEGRKPFSAKDSLPSPSSESAASKERALNRGDPRALAREGRRRFMAQRPCASGARGQPTLPYPAMRPVQRTIRRRPANRRQREAEPPTPELQTRHTGGPFSQRIHQEHLGRCRNVSLLTAIGCSPLCRLSNRLRAKRLKDGCGSITNAARKAPAEAFGIRPRNRPSRSDQSRTGRARR